MLGAALFLILGSCSALRYPSDLIDVLVGHFIPNLSPLAVAAPMLMLQLVLLDVISGFLGGVQSCYEPQSSWLECSAILLPS